MVPVGGNLTMDKVLQLMEPMANVMAFGIIMVRCLGISISNVAPRPTGAQPTRRYERATAREGVFPRVVKRISSWGPIDHMNHVV